MLTQNCHVLYQFQDDPGIYSQASTVIEKTCKQKEGKNNRKKLLNLNSSDRHGTMSMTIWMEYLYTFHLPVSSFSGSTTL